MPEWFGKIESIGRDELENFLVHFDVALFSKRNLAFSVESQLMQIYATISKSSFKDIAKYSNFRERWFRIEIQQRGIFQGESAVGVEFLSHQMIANEETETVRFNVEPVAREKALLLNKALGYALNSIGAQYQDDVESIAANIDLGFSVDRIKVLNVGQGSATCVGLSELPFFYFDVGGGVFQNRHTYRQIRRFHSAPFTTVVLSHWDMDHFFSALQAKNADLLSRNWITPGPVPARPTHTMLALKIKQLGTLNLWPFRGFSTVTTFGRILIGRANGPARNRNASGLVMRVPVSCENRSYQILLTGDAEYQYIPTAILQDINAVIVPHHGGRMRGCVLRSSRGDKHSAHVFSYGCGNSYGHPVANVVAAHQNAGWRTRYDTPKGDVEFGCFDAGWHRRVP